MVHYIHPTLVIHAHTTSPPPFLHFSGLSGCTAEEILKVNPEFIKEAKISQSLTPGRNNGFLNMLQVIKKKAVELTKQAKAQNDESSGSTESDEETSNDTSSSSSDDRPMYNSILASLQQLQPTKVELVDTSYQHAGHGGAKGLDGESHFELTIVADAFEGLNLVKRHQLIYMILGKEMPQIHALSIKANTPSEVENNDGM
jgi:stress-induced morphogen